MILSITGFIGSGKDTFANYLVSEYGYTRLSFASTLKDAVSSIFGWDRTMLEGLTKEAREEREKIDTWWEHRLNMPGLTPRWVLQYFGTEVCKKAFHEDIWNASLERSISNIKNAHSKIIISDARYPNELNMIKRNGGKCIRIKRGIDPTWYNAAVKFNRMTPEDRELLSRVPELLIDANPISLGIHTSEWAWVDYPFDKTLDNSDTLESLYPKINDLLFNIQVTK